MSRWNRSWRAGLVLLALGSIAPALDDARAEPAAQAAPPESPFRSWHFAEGNSRRDFQTFFTLLNLSDEPTSVTASYQRDDGIRLSQWVGILPRGRISLNVNEIVGPRAFGASFSADRDIVVERSTTWGPQQNGETTVGFAPDGQREWYFAEGTTRGQVTTYFVTRNLSDAPVEVTATFTRDDGSTRRRDFGLLPRAREAYRVNDLVPDSSFSAAFRSTEDIIVERTIVSEGPTGVLGGPGYAPAGAEAGSRTWSFAEGSTRRPYLTYFVLFNPGAEATEARFQFALDGGGSREHRLSVPPLGRVAFDPRDVVPAADFATTISTDRPIVVERSYYSTGDGLYGALGYTASEPRRSSRDWYFAEANTTGRIETFFLFFNLSNEPAQVRASYYPDGSGAREQTLSVAARGRLSVRANDFIPDSTFAARFLSDQNLVVERTFYFPGWSGFTTIGAGVPGR